MDFETWWEENGLKEDSFIDKEFSNFLWKSSFKEGYELGKKSRIGLNKSGCACVFDDNDEIIEFCQAHFARLR